MANVIENVGTFYPDGLIYDDKMPVDTKTITLASGAGIISRGTVIAFPADSPGVSGAVWDGTADTVADCVICDDIDTGTTAGSQVVAHAYRKGHLCRQYLIIGEGATLTKAAEKQLQDAGIYLSNAVL